MNKTVNISFPEKTLKEIDEFAKNESLSRSDVVRIGARKYITSKLEWDNISRWGQKFAKAKKLNIEKISKIIAKRRYGER